MSKSADKQKHILCRRCQTELGRADAVLFAKLKCPTCGLVATWRPSARKEEKNNFQPATVLC